MADNKTITTGSDNLSIREMEKGVVAEKGATQDDLDLMELTGHKAVLERNYSTFALLSMSFMIVDSFLGITGSLAAGISSGGTVSSSKPKARLCYSLGNRSCLSTALLVWDFFQ